MSSTYPGNARRRSGGAPARGFQAPDGGKGLPYSRNADRAAKQYNKALRRQLAGPPPPFGGGLPPGSPGSLLKRFAKVAGRIVPLIIIADNLLDLSPEALPERYDWSGWRVINICGSPIGIPRRWSESLGLVCLTNQAVNYPDIRPQDNFAALAFEYEGIGGIPRLMNTINFQRIVPEVPEYETGYPPLLPQRAVEVPDVLVQPLEMPRPYQPAHPIPLPLSLVPALPSLQLHPGLQARQVSYGFFRPPFPGLGLDIELPTQPSIPPRIVPGTGVDAPPRPREKEKKLRIYATGTVVMRIINFATEAKDFVTALHKALPKDCKARPVALGHMKEIKPYHGAHSVVGGRVFHKEKRTEWVETPEAYSKPRFLKKPRYLRHQGVTGNVKTVRTHRAPTMQEMGEAIYKCMEHMTDAQWTAFFKEAAGNVAENELEDRLFGALGRITQRANAKGIRPAGLTFGPAL